MRGSRFSGRFKDGSIEWEFEKILVSLDSGYRNLESEYSWNFWEFIKAR
jgi:hypothetical protein